MHLIFPRRHVNLCVMVLLNNINVKFTIHNSQGIFGRLPSWSRRLFGSRLFILAHCWGFFLWTPTAYVGVSVETDHSHASVSFNGMVGKVLVSCRCPGGGSSWDFLQAFLSEFFLQLNAWTLTYISTIVLMKQLKQVSSMSQPASACSPVILIYLHRIISKRIKCLLSKKCNACSPKLVSGFHKYMYL